MLTLTEIGNSSKHEILIRRRSKKLSKIFRPSTSYPRPSTIYPRPSTFYPRPSTSYPRPSTLDEKANSVCFGSKFTSSVEGRRFNWLIYDSMTSLFACGRFSKSRGLSASVSFLPTFPFPFPLFYSLHSSPCNSLLPNCTETLATQARLLSSLCTSQIEASTSLPATPRIFEKFLFKSPLTGPKSCSNAPNPGKLPDYFF